MYKRWPVLPSGVDVGIYGQHTGHRFERRFHENGKRAVEKEVVSDLPSTLANGLSHYDLGNSVVQMDVNQQILMFICRGSRC